MIAQQQDQAPETEAAPETEQSGVGEDPKSNEAREPEPNATAAAELPDGDVQSAREQE